MQVNNLKITNDYQKANYFNKFFSKIGSNLSKNLNKPCNNVASVPEASFVASSIFFNPTEITEVFNAINKLKNKNGGVDCIHTTTLKNIAHYVSPAISHIINLCFKTGICPKLFKTAEIVPVYKNGEKCNSSNYRPIAQVSNITKIFETVLHRRLVDFIEKNSIINKRQFGFSKNRGSNEALAD